MSAIRHPKDFWSGVMYLAFGLAAVWLARDYGMGSAGRMGPGYFPTVLGALLALIGLISAVRAFFGDGEGIGRFAWGEVALVLGAVLLFGFLVRSAGLVVALPALVVIGAFASKRFRLAPSLLLAAGLTVFSVLVFVKGLGVPMPLFGEWFGG